MGHGVISSTRTTSQLDAGLILIPERYDPRRQQAHEGVKLSELVTCQKQIVDSRKHPGIDVVLVLDTGDADRGLLLPRRAPISASELGSSKKVVASGDVIISRLRPYLHQVAYIPEGVTADNVHLVCSTEFFVLRSNTADSIAFLVTWLLSDDVQKLLEVGQEGGHHPRFTEEQLLGLLIPESVLSRRNIDSKLIVDALNANIEAMRLLRII
jgi:hypothetical protein